MSVSTITSGELYFRAHEVGKQTSTLNNFRKFLHTDVDRDSLQNEYASSRAYLQKCKMHMRKNVDSSLKNSAELIKLLKLRRNRVIAEASESEERIKSRASEVRARGDERLMDIVLQYGSVITSELAAQSANSEEELAAIEAIRRQEIISHELKVFAKYLNLETKGLMSLNFLEKDNEQYKRCKKAIKDNINSKFLRDGNFQGVRVLNICSLQNNRLAKFLQAAVKDDEGGKVKGLFCAIPKKSVYSLCVRGLHLKKDDVQNIYKPAVNTDNKKATPKKGCRVPVNVSNTSKKMFEWSWFCYPPSAEATSSFNPSPSPRKGGRGNSAAPVSVPDLGAHVRGVGSAQHIANESPPLQNDPQKNLRFTRSSTPYDLFAEDGISDEGCFIALCRVLVSRIFKVEDRITASVYLEAARHNYDAIYSEKRDEYVFLKPNHVLPEFLMHVQIVKQPDSGGTSKMEGVNFDSLPKNMISLPHFDRDDKERQLRESSDKDNPSALASNRKLNDWLTQLNNALNNPNANTMTLVERSDPEPMAERLVRETEDVIFKLKNKNASSKHDDVQKIMQLSMQHKQNLYVAVQKTVQDCCSKLQKDCQNQCSNILI